jgi:DNA-directed RNA polymerase specialized sigma24 family protein
MDIKKYAQAKRFAYKLKFVDPIDLVHDAYITWFDKTGKDLFDEPQGRITNVIKFQFKAWLHSQEWYYNKESQGYRTFVEQIEQSYPITPEDEFIGKELEEKMNKLILSSPDSTALILQMRKEGFKNSEIAEELKRTRGWVTKQLEYIAGSTPKDKQTYWFNPHTQERVYYTEEARQGTD